MPDIKFTPVDEIPGATVKLDGKHHHTLVTRIKRGEMGGCEAGEFFAVCRNASNGRADIHITHVDPKPNEDFHERTVAL